VLRAEISVGPLRGRSSAGPWYARPPPHWFAVSAVSAVACGLMTVALGWVAGRCGEVVGGCQQFGDFGCAGYFVLGLYAAPILHEW
jgi:hypothetical protein